MTRRERRRRASENKKYDVSAKELVWEDPSGWLGRFGLGGEGPIEVIDSDITVLTSAADKVLRVLGPSPYLVNIELQAGHDTELARKLWLRHAAIDYRHGLPVHTVLALLTREANSPDLTGVYERSLTNGRVIDHHDYDVVRTWTEPAGSFLEGGLGLVPLAPLGDLGAMALPDLIQRMAPRINREPRTRAATLWTATYILMGLRYDEATINQVLGGISEMEQSVTYQKILREGLKKGQAEGLAVGRAEGRVEGGLMEARRLLLKQGTKKFGHPDAAISATIEGLTDLDRLEAFLERLVGPDVTTWDDLFRAR